MRQILMLLALTCAPAFCQDDNAHIQFNYNPQWFPKLNVFPKPEVVKPGPVLKLQAENSVCSIPLLNVNPAANPVRMPRASVPREPQVFDRIAAKPPAPVCPAR